jgi:hypothetical protein
VKQSETTENERGAQPCKAGKVGVLFGLCSCGQTRTKFAPNQKKNPNLIEFNTIV